jgi:hypothetical protein
VEGAKCLPSKRKVSGSDRTGPTDSKSQNLQAADPDPITPMPVSIPLTLRPAHTETQFLSQTVAPSPKRHSLQIRRTPLVPYQNVKIQKPERAVKAWQSLCTELALLSLVGSSGGGGGNSVQRRRQQRSGGAAANPPPRMPCSLCADDGCNFHTRNIALCAA